MATNYLKKVGLNKDGKVINYLFATRYTDCLKLAYDERRYFILFYFNGEAS